MKSAYAACIRLILKSLLVLSLSLNLIPTGASARPQRISFLDASGVSARFEVENVAAYRALSRSVLKRNDPVLVLGYYTPGDGGGGFFRWNEDSTTADNGGTVLALTAGGKGRGERIFSGALNARWFGVRGDGVTSDAAAVSSLVNSISDGSVVVFDSGTYLFDSQLEFESKHAITLRGIGGTAVFKSTLEGARDCIVRLKDCTKWVFDGLTFNAPNGQVFGVGLQHCSEIAVRNCVTVKACLLITNVSHPAYAAVDESVYSTDITVEGNVCNGDEANKATMPQGCIHLLFAKRASVVRNQIRNYYHGIYWWGGDAAPGADGAMANERKCKDLVISGNIVTDCGSLQRGIGGGIWGSMGDGVLITENVVKRCGDVCIDPEGSFNVTVSGNMCEDAKNGVLAFFNVCKNVVFSGNVVTVTNLAYFPFRGSDSAVLYEGESVSVIGNSFECTDGIALADMGSAYVEQFTFRGNTLKNVQANLRTYEASQVAVDHNSIVINAAGATYGVRVGPCRRGGASVLENIIRLQKASAGSIGIVVLRDSGQGAVTPVYRIERNEVHGFTYDLATRRKSAVESFEVICLLIEGNTFSAGAVDHELDADGIHRYRQFYSGNRKADGSYWPTGIPTSPRPLLSPSPHS